MSFHALPLISLNVCPSSSHFNTIYDFIIGLSARELAAKYGSPEYTDKPKENSSVIGKLELDLDDEIDEVDKNETETYAVDKKGAPLIKTEETNEGDVPLVVEQVELDTNSNTHQHNDIQHDKDEQESDSCSSSEEFSKVGAHDKAWELYHRHRLPCMGALLLLLFLAIAIPVAISLARRPIGDTNNYVKLSIDNVTSTQKDLSNALQACVCSALFDQSNEGIINTVEGVRYQCIKDDHVTTNQLTRQPDITLCVYPSDESVLDGYRLGNELKKLTMTVTPSNSTTTNNTKYDLLNQDEDGGRYSFDTYQNATGKAMTLNISIPHVDDYLGSIVEVCSSVVLMPKYHFERRGYEIKEWPPQLKDEDRVVSWHSDKVSMKPMGESDAVDDDPRNLLRKPRMLQDLPLEDQVASFCLPITFDADHSANYSSGLPEVSFTALDSTVTSSSNDIKGKISKCSSIIMYSYVSSSHPYSVLTNVSYPSRMHV